MDFRGLLPPPIICTHSTRSQALHVLTGEQLVELVGTRHTRKAEQVSLLDKVDRLDGDASHAVGV